jgi:2-amino-4-hydroxy-6-hydroxymethyldihydropteridine diphosphokinase
MHNEARVFVALGSNLPHEGVSGPELLSRAVSAMRAAGLRLRARSGVWETAAWPPGCGQPNYVNAVVELDPEGLSPQPLYETLCSVERAFGRERRDRWAPRSLDLDIVAMDGWEGEFGALTLPHPRMHERAFVLAPLAEIAPGWRHPRLGQTTQELLSAVAGEGYRRLGDLDGG